MIHALSSLKLAALLAGAALLHGCAMQAPAYSPSLPNVDAIKKADIRSTSIGAFTVQAGLATGSSIGLRGNPMSSAVGGDYAAYLAEALRQELVLAGKLDPKSDLQIGGTLVKNDIAAGGISTNSGEIEARFVVTRGGTTRYEGVKRVDATWDSSFIGSVAIPKAQQQYPVMVQQLLARLLADPQFIAALK